MEVGARAQKGERRRLQSRCRAPTLPAMRDRIWIVLILALLLGVVVGWWGKGRWAEHACQVSGGTWYDTASACGKVSAKT